MKKKELIDRVAEKAETSRAAAARVFEAIFDSASGAITEAVKAGEQVSIPGFGKFRTKDRPARKGRNPQTGAEIDIPERTVVQFAAGKGLHDAIRGEGGTRRTATRRSPAKGATAAKTAKGTTATKAAKPAAQKPKGSARKGAARKGSTAKGSTAKGSTGKGGASRSK